MQNAVWMLLAAAVCSVPTDGWCGRNAGGALIVHTDSSVSYTDGIDFCAELRDLDRCIDADTWVDAAPGSPAVIWILAAFPAGASPAVRVINFGLHHTVGPMGVAAWGVCDPAEMLIAYPEDEFPGSGTGISVPFYPTVYKSLFPFVWFAVQGNPGDQFGVGVDNLSSTAVFVDESQPGQSDEITRFGYARWGSEGDNDCPLSVEHRDASLGQIKAGFR
jgi:hypothetical protein